MALAGKKVEIESSFLTSEKAVDKTAFLELSIVSRDLHPRISSVFPKAPLVIPHYIVTCSSKYLF